MEKRYYFCSFSDFNLLPSLLRIKKQASSLDVFAKINIYTQFSLPKLSKEKVKKVMKKTGTKKGYGFWSWKVDIISDTFSEMEEGDILLYADAGCEINKLGIEKLKYYFELTDVHDVCAVQLPDSMSDINYTKRDTLELFTGIPKNKLDDGQVQATCLFIKKNCYTKKLLKEWSEFLTVENIHYFDDSPSRVEEFPQFIVHRHDQSILSLLLKENHFFSLPIESFWAEEGKWGGFIRPNLCCLREIKFI